MEIEFINSVDERILFGPPYYRVKSIGGLGDVESDIQTQKSPYQDGSTYVASYLNERVIPIELKVYGENEVDLSEKRKYLSRVFNPKHGIGTLKVTIGENIYLCYPVPDFIPKFGTGADNMGNFFHNCQLQLTAPGPYWREPYEVSRALTAYRGKFEFPFNFPIEFGIEGDSVILENKGTVETPVEINIQGPIRNPKITNRTTGKFIRVNRTLSADEVLHINTDKQNKRVEIYRNDIIVEKAWGYLDDYSNLFTLSTGNNDISFIADSSMDDSIASISWKTQHAGI